MRNKNYEYLKDISFLTELAKSPLLSSLVRISFLDWQENIIKQIESQVISGNINIDGNSAIRRTASLGLILKENENVQNLFLINKKINIQIGYCNETDKYQEYPILWFPQGIFVITNFSLSHGLDGLSVSLELKDKMCLLNGECGGVLPASTVFDNYETIDENGQYVVSRPTIYQIIKQLVNHFGGQDLTRIIVSDLDLKVKQAMKWNNSSTPLYFLWKNNQYFVTIDESKYITLQNEGWRDIDGSPFIAGSNVGFIYTDFTYPGDLIGDAGQSVVDILEQIKETLGNYEYFYDINGNFIFQQIKNFLNNTQAKYVLESFKSNQVVPDYLSSTRQAYLLDRANGNIIFDFSKNNSVLISSYSITPQLNMIKNDFVIWGIKKFSDNKELPIRYHLAIDKKPQIGNTYYAFSYLQEGTNIQKWIMPIKCNNYEQLSKIKGEVGKYYLDVSQNIVYKWDENSQGEYQYIATEKGSDIKRITTTDWRTQLYFQGVAAEVNGTDRNFYYTELVNEWPKIYNIVPDRRTTIVDRFLKSQYTNISVWNKNYFYNDTVGRYYYCKQDRIIYKCIAKGDPRPNNYATFSNYYQAQDMTYVVIPDNVNSLSTASFYTEIRREGIWVNDSDFKQETWRCPDQIEYFLDFIDTTQNIGKYSVNNIGRRTKVINDGNNSNCVFEAYIPDIVLLKLDSEDMAELRQECERKNQKYYQLEDYLYDNLAIGGSQYSCYQSIRQTLHEYLSYNESISLQTLPLYFLQPNNCVKVQDKQSNIEGNYIINSISFNLGDNSQMTISASKILQKI